MVERLHSDPCYVWGTQNDVEAFSIPELRCVPTKVQELRVSDHTKCVSIPGGIQMSLGDPFYTKRRDITWSSPSPWTPTADGGEGTGECPGRRTHSTRSVSFRVTTTTGTPPVDVSTPSSVGAPSTSASFCTFVTSTLMSTGGLTCPRGRDTGTRGRGPSVTRLRGSDDVSSWVYPGTDRASPDRVSVTRTYYDPCPSVVSRARSRGTTTTRTVQGDSRTRVPVTPLRPTSGGVWGPTVGDRPGVSLVPFGVCREDPSGPVVPRTSVQPLDGPTWDQKGRGSRPTVRARRFVWRVEDQPDRGHMSPYFLSYSVSEWVPGNTS